MVAVALARADLALVSDLDVRAEIPHLSTSSPDRAFDGALIKFAGDKLPTSFRGEGGSRQWDCSAIYGSSEQQLATELVQLLERASTEPDGRMLWRPHYATHGGVSGAYRVICPGYKPVPGPGLSLVIQFTLHAVV